MSRQTVYRYQLTVHDGRPWPPLEVRFATLEPALAAMGQITSGPDRDLYAVTGPGRVKITAVK